MLSLYSPLGSIRRKIGFRKADNENWQKCWKKYEGREFVTNESCYKSTLIVPLKLRDQGLQPEFRQLLHLNEEDSPIFGFLCLDHVELDYFQESFDVSISYVFADILFNYYFKRFIFTLNSSVYEEVKQKRKNNFEDNYEKKNSPNPR